VENALSTRLGCLPPSLLVIAIALVIGRTPASPAQDSGATRVSNDSEELNCSSRLALLDGKPEAQADPRDRSRHA